MKCILLSQRSLFVAILALLPMVLWGCGASTVSTPTPAPTATTAALVANTPTVMSVAATDTPAAMETTTMSTPTVMTGTMESTPTAMGSTMVASPTAAMSATMAVTPTAMGGMMPSGSPTSGMAGTGQNGEMVQQAATQDYSLTLRLGPVAMMLAPGQAQGATSGEVMISGQMAMTGTGGMAPNYHLELAVNDIKSGAVITDKSVTIDLTNTTTNERQSVPISTMYNVQVGPSDTHFGNNVALAPGTYMVDVDVSGEKATFNITTTAMGGTPVPMDTPGAMMPGMTPTP